MLLLALLLSCSDHIINEVKQPEIIVAPATLEFGHLLSGHESRTRTVTIANGGTAELVIDRLDIDGENYIVDEAGFTIESGAYYQIEVTYDPKTFEHNEGYLDIYLEGDEEPSEGVWLNGNGDAPVITVTPSEHDFGSPLLGCDTTKEIIIQNDGNVDLSIDDINIMASVPPDITIDLGTLPEFPWTIPAGGRIAFFSNYAPLDTNDDLTTFDILSSDPLNPVFAAFAEGAAVLSNEKTQSWIQKSILMIDIVWIIDNSGSMNFFQSMLGNNMADFMQIFLSYSPDFQMVFITTDNPTFISNIIDRSTRDPIGEAVDQINSIGIGGSGNEKGLSMLAQCMDGGQCSDIARRDANFIAIFLSDEPDHSGGSLINFINIYEGAKPGMFKPYAIIGDPPSGCSNNGNGWTPQAGYGYWDLVQHYASQWFSICDEDWGAQLEEIAQDISIQTVFEIESEDPHVNTLRVWINGQLVTEGWAYDEDLNAVVFTYEDAPEAGDSVDISYSTWGCGEE